MLHFFHINLLLSAPFRWQKQSELPSAPGLHRLHTQDEAYRPGHRQDVQRSSPAGSRPGVDRAGDEGDPQPSAPRGSAQHAAHDDALLVDIQTGGDVPQSILLATGWPSFLLLVSSFSSSPSLYYPRLYLRVALLNAQSTTTSSRSFSSQGR